MRIIKNLIFFSFLIISNFAFQKTNLKEINLSFYFFAKNEDILEDKSIDYFGFASWGAICFKKDSIIFNIYDEKIILKNINFEKIVTEGKRDLKLNIFSQRGFKNLETYERIKIKIKGNDLTFDKNKGLIISNKFENIPWIVFGARDFEFKGDELIIETERDKYLIKLNNLKSKIFNKNFSRGKEVELVWGSYVDMEKIGKINTIKTDSDGNVIIGGSSNSIINGAKYDIFLSKISYDGSKIFWFTFISGSEYDYCNDFILDEEDNIYLIGSTSSPDIPVLNGFQMQFKGFEDIYIAHISSEGDKILWATYYGKEHFEEGNKICFDSNKNLLTISTFTHSTYTNYRDIIIAKISSDCNLLWEKKIGGLDQDFGKDIKVDKDNNIIIAGNTYSDIYLAKLSEKGEIIWEKYFGGSSFDNVSSIQTDIEGNVIVFGSTGSSNFPVNSGFDISFNGFEDIYILKISSNGDKIIWSTFLGGSNNESAGSMILDSDGNILIVGTTSSEDLPITDRFSNSNYLNFYNIYLAKISIERNYVIWASLIGGYFSDFGKEIVLDKNGAILIYGITESPDIPTPNGFDSKFTYREEGYLAKLFEVNKEVPPVADFDWKPKKIKVNQEIYFEDKSIFSPTSWYWNFSDNTFSMEKNPKKIYDKSGIYDVSLIVSNNYGMSEAKKKVEVQPLKNNLYFVPVVAKKFGNKNMKWLSDLMILNSNNKKNCFDIFLVENGKEGNDIEPSLSMCLEGYDCIYYEDIIGNIYNENSNFLGNIRIESEYPVLISSKIYFLNELGGTISENVPVVNKKDFEDSNGNIYLFGLKNTEEFRTNIGFLAVEEKETNIYLDLFDSYGNLLKSKNITLLPYSSIQYSYDSLGFPKIKNAYLEVSSNSKFYCYAEVIDNLTGSSLFIPAQRKNNEGKESPKYLPIATLSSGNYGSLWTTDLYFLNLEDEKEVGIDYFYKQNIVKKTIFIGSKEEKVIENVISKIFEIDLPSYGFIRLDNFYNVLAYASINNINIGKYFQFLPVISLNDTLEQGDTGYLLHLKNDSNFRNNIGFVNFSIFPSTITLKIYNLNSDKVFEKLFVIPGNGILLLNDFFQKFKIQESSKHFYAKIDIDSGEHIFSYVSIVDNITNDPIFFSILKEDKND